MSLEILARTSGDDDPAILGTNVPRLDIGYLSCFAWLVIRKWSESWPMVALHTDTALRAVTKIPDW
jgi:hypothetical protein